MSRFFEEIRVGEQTALGSHLFTAEEILRFAERYDPQPFHVDEEAATASHFGGLIASGWHTAVMWLRLLIDHRQRSSAGPLAAGERRARVGPSPGFRELRWPAPVRPGDSVSYSTRVADKIHLAARPNWGLVVSRNEGVNHRGETVLSFLGEVYVERRTTGATRSSG